MTMFPGSAADSKISKRQILPRGPVWNNFGMCMFYSRILEWGQHGISMYLSNMRFKHNEEQVLHDLNTMKTKYYVI